MRNEHDRMSKQKPVKNDVLDVLLDAENKDPIVLTDEKGKSFAFEQIAVIPYNQRIYAVLHPIDRIEGVEDDEAVVFYVDDSKDDPVLVVETDEPTALAVFGKYYDLLEKGFKKEDD